MKTRSILIALAMTLTVMSVAPGGHLNAEASPAGYAYQVSQGSTSFIVDPVVTAGDVAAFYGYGVPTDPPTGPAYAYSAADTVMMMLHEGSDGISLVFIVDQFGDGTGGDVDFSIAGLPAATTWAIQDDAPGGADTYSSSAVHWVWGGPYGDGGALNGGLDATFSIDLNQTAGTGLSALTFHDGTGNQSLAAGASFTIATVPDNDDDNIPDVDDPDDDNDGYSDVDEAAAGSDPLDASSTPEICDGLDNDGNDGVDEGFLNSDGDAQANCVDDDDDNDGLSDVDEASNGTDPLDPDTDNDGVSDGDEVHTYNSNPLSSDTDGDGLHDGAEVAAGTDLHNPDSDGDGVLDGADAFPLDATETIDSDGDGIGDNSDPDDDNDGLFDVDEATAGSDPFNWDTDQDLIADGVEVHNHTTDPTLADTDGDGLSDFDELYGGTNTNALRYDSDADCFGDGDEFDYGTDPNDPASYPQIYGDVAGESGKSLACSQYRLPAMSPL